MTGQFCLPTSSVITFNEGQLGRSPTLRDRGLLESALAAPLQSFDGNFLYPTPIERSAALLWRITQNHPFDDGNKRTAWWSCTTYLAANGLHLVSMPPAEAGQVVQNVAEGYVTHQQLADWIIDRLQ